MEGVYDNQSIAVIGLSCRLPGDADNAERFWDLLREGKSAISDVPEGRWNNKGFRDARGQSQNASGTNRAHFLKGDISEFDANFFSISKAEAVSMDPQQRLMLEVSYEAFENAGLSMDLLSKSQTGCWVSSFSHDWKEMQFSDPDSAPKYAMSGMQPEMLANRVSYFFDLRGPSMAVETACSGSLVGLHVACQSLRSGECDTALVGGANLFLGPNMFIALSNQNFLAPDGLSKAFDASANGYGRGEGFAAVILKPIEKAILDGDPIRAVIRGTGSNQDGKTKGLTMPNGEAQEALIRATYRSAGVDMKDTPYFEAHGTGTQVGDFEELSCIARTVAGARRDAGRDDLWVGSAKTNVGHCEATAGLVGVLKAVLMVENGFIPRNLHFHNPNPRIPFNKWHIRVPTEQIQWPAGELRRVSVNSFGFGGSNAHAIVEDAKQYTSQRRAVGVSGMNGVNGVNGNNSINGSNSVDDIESTSGDDDPPQIFHISAGEQEGLARQRCALLEYITKREKGESPGEKKLLGDLAYTLGQKRSRLPWRTFSTASTLPELRQALEATEFPKIRARAALLRIAYVFTGQGAQWPQMGMDLVKYPVFRESVEAADRHLAKIGCPWSAVEELRRVDLESNIHVPWFSQTLCTVLQVALVELLQSWNITPRSVVGHSSGEMGAAFAIGAISRDDAWTIAYWRGKLSSELSNLAPELKGSMMAVGSSKEQAQLWVDGLTQGKCVVACVNSPSSVTVSGDEAGLDELGASLKEKGVFARKLKVTTAYHSHHMKVVAEAYLDAIKDIKTKEVPGDGPQMFTSVNGKLAKASDLGPSHWVANLVSPVLFSNTVAELVRPKGPEDEAIGSAVDLFLEIGPHAALRGPTTQVLQAHGFKDIDYQSFLSRGCNSVDTTLAAIGCLICRGLPVDVEAVNSSAQLGRKTHPAVLTDLLPYAWNHSKTYWSESRMVREARHRASAPGRLIGAPMPTFGAKEHQWRGFLRLSDAPWIRDHKVQSAVILPAGSFLTMAIEAASQVAGNDHESTPKGYKLRDVEISSAVTLDDESSIEHIIQLRPHAGSEGDRWWEFTISTSSGPEEALRRNCSGLVAVEFDDFEASAGIPLGDYQSCVIPQDAARFYDQLDTAGLYYGPTFQAVKSIHHNGKGLASGIIEITDAEATKGESRVRPHVVHPTTLESVFQVAYAAFGGRTGRVKRGLLVTEFDELVVDASIPYAPGAQLQGLANASRRGFREMVADVRVLAGSSGASIRGLTCVEMPSASGADSGQDEAGREGYESMLSKVVWKPSLELLSTAEKEKLLHSSTNQTDSDAQALVDEEAAGFHAVKAALEAAQRKKIASMKLRNASRWITQQLQGSGLSSIPVENSEMQSSASELIGPVDNVLSGQSGSEVLLGTKTSAEQFLSALSGVKVSVEKQHQLVSLMAHANPELAVLEIGAGGPEGQATSLLSSDNIPSTVQYTYASTSAEQVRSLQESVKATKLSTQFRVLDIEQDLSDQDIEAGSFDIIIGSNLLSRAVNVERVLDNAKSILKEGGQIYLVELTNPSPRALPVLGIFCDWWKRGDDGLRRPFSSDKLNDILDQQGFTVDLTSPDFVDSPIHQSSLVVASQAAPPEESVQAAAEEEVIILVGNPRSTQSASKSLATQLALGFKNGRVVPWGSEEADFKGKHLISLLEFDAPFLNKLTAQDFEALKQLITQASSLLWVTAIPEPHASTVLGLARVVRFELPSLQFRVLTLDPSSAGAPERAAAHISKVQSTRSREKEFKEIDSVINIPRIDIDPPLNRAVSKLCLDEDIEPMALGSGGVSRKICIRSPGMLSSLCFEADDMADTGLEQDEVEMEVKASGVNQKDIMVALGQIPDNFLGLEASGVVTRIGSGVTELQPGDKICMLAKGAHRATLRGKAAVCQKIPDGLSFDEAAGLPWTYSTAYHALVNVARLRKGQAVLIHAAAGAVGQAAIQLSQHFGLEIFATAGSPGTISFIKQAYGIPEDRIYSQQDKKFVQEVLRGTGGSGVDSIISPISGGEAPESWSCLAPFGTFVELGLEDGRRRGHLNARAFRKDAVFAAVNIEHILELRPAILGEAMQSVLELFRQNQLKAVVPPTAYPVSEAEQAIQATQDGTHHGGVVLSFASEHVVPVLHSPRDSLVLPGDRTYVIAGGVGGIGRSIATLLVDCGARHLALLSRSGVTSDAQRKLIENLEKRGGNIRVYKCNIGDAESLGQALSQCQSEMPPTKGVIHSAVVFRDAVMHNLTYKQWSELMEGKLDGSWNLHELTTSYDLDFFLCIGSFMAIIGGLSQSNYAAGGAFQDGLAHMRQSQGLPAATIDLGIVKGFGAVEEQGAVGHTLEWREPFGVNELEVHALIKKALLGQLEKGASGVPPQLINSIPTGGMVRNAGIDEPYYFDDPRLSIMAAIGTKDAAGSDRQACVALKEQLAQAAGPDEAIQLVVAAVVVKVAKLMQAGVDEIDTAKSLHAYGVDSLVAVEYVSWAKKEVAAEITVFDVMSSVPITVFARNLVGKGKWAAAKE